MDKIRLQPTSLSFNKTIRIEGSKSLANRALIIQALCPEPFEIINLPKADDTVFLKAALNSTSQEIRVGSGGTTFRFLLAYFAFQKGTQILVTEGHLKNRPIEPLLTVLAELGATISTSSDSTWVVGEPDWSRYEGGVLDIDASVSSQFVSALLLVAPSLPKGLKLRLSESVASSSYISMTIHVMRYFGVEVEQGTILEVKPQQYIAKDYKVEPDWSSLSYLFGWVAITKGAEVKIPDMEEDSWQSDRACMEFFKELGVESYFADKNLILKNIPPSTTFAEFDISENPDLFPVLSVVCAIHGIQVLYSGLDNLIFKESNRIEAIQHSLEKTSVFLSKLPTRFSKRNNASFYLQEGKAEVVQETVFPTYEDHRIAMSVALFGDLQPIVVESPTVVQKSFPDYWKMLEELGVVAF